MFNKVFKTVKFVSNMKDDKNSNNNDPGKRAERTVRNHVMWSMGAGFIPFPVADFLAVAAVQLDMIRGISNIYNVDFKETEGKALITSLTGSGLSRVGANALVKMIPGVGSLIGGVSMSILSGASTYALGQVFKKHFETGGTFLDFDTSRFKNYYEEQFEKGKKVAEDIREEQKDSKKKKEDAVKQEEAKDAEAKQDEAPRAAPHVEEAKGEEEGNKDAKADSSEIVRKLKELAELKEMGVITDEEFNQMKARLIANYK